MTLRSPSALRLSLLIAGVVEIAVGLLHFGMPGQYRRSAGLSHLGGAEDDFIVLVTFAVGILLIAFGAVTLLFSRNPVRHLDVLYWYLLIKVALWAGRLALEILYPIQLRMFGLDPFTAIVAPGLATELAVFALAALQTRWMLRRLKDPDRAPRHHTSSGRASATRTSRQAVAIITRTCRQDRQKRTRPWLEAG